MNQQTINLVAAAVAVFVIGLLLFFGGIDGSMVEVEMDTELVEDLVEIEENVLEIPSYEEVTRTRYVIQFGMLADWITGDARIFIAGPPSASIQELFREQEQLILALMGVNDSVVDEKIETAVQYLQDLMLKPGYVTDRTWAQVLFSNDTYFVARWNNGIFYHIHQPLYMASAFSDHRVNPQMMDDFEAIVRGATADDLDLTINRLRNRIRRWDDFYRSNPVSRARPCSERSGV